MSTYAYQYAGIDVAGSATAANAAAHRATRPAAGVVVDGVAKDFGATAALHGVSLEIAAGELIALLGPSGSGKTTLLRILAGLEFPTAGRVLFGNDDAATRTVQERNVGFVFQHYALFRHMSVFDNVAFGLKVRPRSRRPRSDAIRARVLQLLDLVQLAGLEHRYPAQLSGGQRQRVALARALAIEPRILLLDEPFGALDAKVRKDLRRWLRDLHDRTGHTTVFVTHDQDEAMELADRVVVMSQGRIEQVGSADDIYDRPATPFVFSFIGESSMLPVEIDRGRIHMEGRLVGIAPTDHPDGPYSLGLRPHHAVIDMRGEGAISGMVRASRRIGGVRRLDLEVGMGRHRAEIDVPIDAAVPEDGLVSFRPTQWTLFDRSGGPDGGSLD
ncbi:sulfate/molybdate ABC transporter ATP-binding protein [Microbaculum marinum]|uniref:Sulfate/molybdate ABC transporter ATP-binding protein n=1 Tax=Microbaculum marinum TaxID=1764581 RepID=A0AAW9RNN8_9HYPH